MTLETIKSVHSETRAKSPESLGELIHRFKKSPRFTSYSRSTRYSYTYLLNSLAGYCEGRKVFDITGLDEAVNDWIDQSRKRRRTPDSIKPLITSYTAFRDWIRDEELAQTDENRSRVLTHGEVSELIPKARNPRDACIILIPLKTGAQIEEVLNLEGGDVVKDDDGRFLILFPGIKRTGGLERNPRELHIDKNLGNIITEYIKFSKINQGQPLFKKGLGKKMSPEMALNILKGYGQEIEIPDLNFHTLTNTFSSGFKGSPAQLRKTLGLI